MMIRILFFAQLRELLGCNQIELQLTEPMDIKELTLHILNSRPDWKEHLQSATLLYAVNQQLVGPDALVKAGDEVAFFPPVTGG